MDSVLSPAIPVWSDQQIQVGTVATPLYPGPITEDHSGGPESYAPGSPSGPPMGTASILSYFDLPPVIDDIPGELGDTAAVYGHAAPIADYDSNAGEPFTSSGPIADTHGFDTGGTERKFSVIQPRAGTWWRRTIPGQTWNKTVTYDETGKIISTDNNRTDFDQYQGHDADASDPKWIPYSERPVYLNIAHAPVAVGTDQQTAYTPSLDLSPVGPLFWTSESNIYETPPDPQVNTAAEQQSSQQASAVGFWG
jgi:hypothetical protein